MNACTDLDLITMSRPRLVITSTRPIYIKPIDQKIYRYVSPIFRFTLTLTISYLSVYHGDPRWALTVATAFGSLGCQTCFAALLSCLWNVYQNWVMGGDVYYIILSIMAGSLLWEKMCWLLLHWPNRQSPSIREIVRSQHLNENSIDMVKDYNIQSY